jgi:NtrC-family two-component system sensor histidine kinase KinB
MTHITNNTGLEQPRLALLYQISREVSSRLDITELLPRLLQLTLNSIAGHSGSLVVFDDQGRLRHSALLINGQFHPDPERVLQPVIERGLAGWAVQHREAVYVADINTDPRWYRSPDKTYVDSRSAIVVPLIGRERVVGVITVGRLPANAFEPDDVAFTAAIAAQAGIAVENAQLFAAERRGREISNTLREVARTVNATLDLDRVLPLILEQLARVIAFDSASILLRQGDRLQVAAAHGFDNLPAVMAVSFDADHGLAGQVVNERLSLVLDDVRASSEWQTTDIPETKAIRAWIGAPLVAKDQVMGLLSVDSRRVGAYSAEDSQLVAAFAEQAAVAVLNARLYADSERRSYGLRALAATAQAINGAYDLDEVLRLVTQHAAEALGMEAASLALIQNGRLVFKQAVGPVGDNLVGLSIALGPGIAGWVAQNNEPIIVPDVRVDPRFYGDVDKSSGFVTRALACVPVRIENRAIGVIEVMNPARGSFDPDTLDLLDSLASLAGTAIVQAQRVAELKAAENRFAALFEDSLDPIIVTDLEGTISDANRRAAEFYGYSRSELVSMRITHLHRVRTDSLASGRYTPLLTGAAISYQTRITTRAGQEVPVEVHAKLIDRGGAKFIHWIQHDMSDRVALEELRNDLMSMIVHDLRSPLGNIMSALDILRSTLPGDDEMLNSLLSIVGRATARLSRLVNSLLDLRRLETGDVMLNRVPINPVDLLKEALEQVQPMADAKNLQLQIIAPPAMPDVPLDVDMIRRVFINLLDNAVKYTPQAGAITIMLKTGRERLTVNVRDTGPGIPEGEQERIFNKFTRVQRDSAPQGLGLGLAFCKLAIEAHGGRIWAETTLDLGANFTFIVPIVPAPVRPGMGPAQAVQ